MTDHYSAIQPRRGNYIPINPCFIKSSIWTRKFRRQRESRRCLRAAFLAYLRSARFRHCISNTETFVVCTRRQNQNLGRAGWDASARRNVGRFVCSPHQRPVVVVWQT